MIAEGARVKLPGERMHGEPVELVARHHAHRENHRMNVSWVTQCAATMRCSASDECVEAAWAVVDRALAHETAVDIYEPGTWGPDAAAKIVGGSEGWHDPAPEASGPC